MRRQHRQGYSTLQIVLHWTIAGLILLQFLLSDGVEDAWDEVKRGRPAETEVLLAANLHVASGITILVLAILRIAIILRRGAPPLPAATPRPAKIAASLTHLALYGLIVGMPLAGISAWFLGIEDAADWHEAGAKILVGVVLLHAAGAFVEQFVMRTGVLKRMLVPERNSGG
jgi:cytochrome b561